MRLQEIDTDIKYEITNHVVTSTNILCYNDYHYNEVLGYRVKDN